MSGTAPVTGPATRPGGSRPGVPGPVAAVLRAPFTRRAWAEFGYAMAGLPLGVAGFAFTVATLAAGAALTLTVLGILVGLPLLAVSSLGARGLGAVNRGLARRLLGVRVAAPPPFRPQPGLIVWVRSALTDAASWRARAYLVLKLPVSVLSGFVAAYFWLGGLAYLTYPLWWQIFHQVSVHVDGVTQPEPSHHAGPVRQRPYPDLARYLPGDPHRRDLGAGRPVGYAGGQRPGPVAHSRAARPGLAVATRA